MDEDLIEKRLAGESVFDGKLLHVRRDTVLLPNGHETKREWVKHPGASAVLPVLDDGSVILVRQYRYPVGRVTLEIPAGKLDVPGEDPLECAKRELKEETGYAAERYEKLFSLATTVGFSDEWIHIYLAEGLTAGADCPDEDEFIHTVRMPLAEALEKVSDNTIVDGKTVTALLLYAARRKCMRREGKRRFDMFGFNLMEMVAGLPGLIMALALHEYAHARAAVAMGDFTPRMMGRLTLNPLAHIDPIGLAMLLIARFGWAKPVVINPHNFRDRKKGEILVALAGPAMNFLLAFLAVGVLLILTRKMHMELSYGLRSVLWLIVVYNINFGVFNLIPLPPLDGSRILMAVLPYEMQYRYAGLERYSMIIFLIFIATPILGYILIPIAQFLLGLFSGIWMVIL